MVRQYTPMKYKFDELTAKWFRSRGYITEILSSPCFCDVVAWLPTTKRFAICEVKSPREIDAMVSWETEYNIKGMSRKKILEQIKKVPEYKDDPGLWRLYSFTLASQLFTYHRSAEEHIDVAMKRNIELNKIDIKKVKIVPCLAVAIEKEKVIRKVIACFKEKKWLKSSMVYKKDRLIIASVRY